MAFEQTKFCFNCKISEEDLLRQRKFCISLRNTKLKACSNCKIAEYCGRQCQSEAWNNEHKNWCKKINDPKKNRVLQRQGINVELRDCRNAYLMSALFESHHGVQKTLDMFLPRILEDQPNNLLRRYGAVMMYLNLGQDDAAYNFLKFWLMKSKNRGGALDWGAFMLVPGESEIIPEPSGAICLDRPIESYCLDRQDKMENLFEELEIDLVVPPIYLDVLFYIELLIIKCNIWEHLAEDAQKFEQEKQMKEILKYLENHYPGLARNLMSIENSPEDELMYMRAPHICPESELTENYCNAEDLILPEHFGIRIDDNIVDIVIRVISMEKLKIKIYLSRALPIQRKLYEVLRQCE